MQGPAAVAKAIDRSSGAVANCLKRLAANKEAKQVSDKAAPLQPRGVSNQRPPLALPNLGKGERKGRPLTTNKPAGNCRSSWPSSEQRPSYCNTHTALKTLEQRGGR